MTLVIVSRKQGKVSLTSDSRFTYSSGYFDFGIKVSPVPVKIKSPINERQEFTIDYQHTIGVALTGSVVSAATIKTYIIEALQNLQYTPGITDFSFEEIIRFILKIYKLICNELFKVLRTTGICDLIIAGYCPKDNNIKVYQLYSKEFQGNLIQDFKEISLNEGVEFFGSGMNAAKIVKAENKGFSDLNILRAVVKDATVQAVGGTPQCGSFSEKNFHMTGIMRPDPKPDNENNMGWNLWGIDHYQDEFIVKDTGFILSYNFIMEHDAIY